MSNLPARRSCYTALPERASQPALEETRICAVRAVGLLAKTPCCPALLCQEASAPLVGHALSLLLEVARQEALAGDRGSRTLRGDALRVLNEVLETVRLRLPLPCIALNTLAGR